VPARHLEHVTQSRTGDPSVIGFVFGGWGFAERLAVILLVKATPSATDVRAVVSLGEQEGTFAGPASSDLRRRDPNTLCQGQAECLVLDAAPKLRSVRLENVRRRRAVHRDAYTACVVDGNGELRLRAGEGHRDALLTDKERLVREFLYDLLEVF